MILGVADTTTIAGGTLNKVDLIGQVGKIKEISRVKDVSIKAFPCPKVNDAGLSGAWWWADKIALAVAAWALYQNWLAAKEEYKIAKRYYDLADQQWRHFYQNYRPLEQQELNEIHAEAVHKPNYSEGIKGHTHLIDPIFNQIDKHRLALVDKYNVCPDVSEFSRIELVKSTVRGDSDNFARRYEERLAQEKNDTRWSRRITAMQRGRGLLNQSTQFASRAATMFDEYAKAMGGLAGGAMSFIGYVNNRNQTQYNQARDRVNPRAEVPNTYRGFDAEAWWSNNSVMNGFADSGGLTWGSLGGEAPYMQAGLQSGFDPTGIVAPLTTTST